MVTKGDGKLDTQINTARHRTPRKKGVLKELASLQNYLEDALTPVTRLRKNSQKCKSALAREQRDLKRATKQWYDPLID